MLTRVFETGSVLTPHAQRSLSEFRDAPGCADQEDREGQHQVSEVLESAKGKQQNDLLFQRPSHLAVLRENGVGRGI